MVLFAGWLSSSPKLRLDAKGEFVAGNAEGAVVPNIPVEDVVLLPKAGWLPFDAGFGGSALGVKPPNIGVAAGVDAPFARLEAPKDGCCEENILCCGALAVEASDSLALLVSPKAGFAVVAPNENEGVEAGFCVLKIELDAGAGSAFLASGAF